MSTLPRRGVRTSAFSSGGMRTGTTLARPAPTRSGAGARRARTSWPPSASSASVWRRRRRSECARGRPCQDPAERSALRDTHAGASRTTSLSDVLLRLGECLGCVPRRSVWNRIGTTVARPRSHPRADPALGEVFDVVACSASWASASMSASVRMRPVFVCRCGTRRSSLASRIPGSRWRYFPARRAWRARSGRHRPRARRRSARAGCRRRPDR